MAFAVGDVVVDSVTLFLEVLSETALVVVVAFEVVPLTLDVAAVVVSAAELVAVVVPFVLVAVTVVVLAVLETTASTSRNSTDEFWHCSPRCPTNS